MHAYHKLIDVSVKVAVAKEYMLSGQITRNMSLADLWDPADRLLPRFFEDTSLLPDNAAEICSNRLVVSCTDRVSGRNKQFCRDNEELLSVLQASCSFNLNGIKLADGQTYWDGGMSDALPVCDEPNATIITVCPFSGTSSISPQDYREGQGRTYSVCGIGLHLSANNLVRGFDTTFPRGTDVMHSYFKAGQRDAKEYLQRQIEWEVGEAAVGFAGKPAHGGESHAAIQPRRRSWL
jgi:predicted acylesterase/phospholipase RssA